MSKEEEDSPHGTGAKRDAEEIPIRVRDRRHWAQPDPPDSDDGFDDPQVLEPSAVRELRQRAEEAERKLSECISAFREARLEQEQFRERMTRDVERRIQLGFGNLVSDLVECVDDLDLALTHAAATPATQALTDGVALARNRFLGALEKAGVARIDPTGEAFDPHRAEAIRLVPVATPDEDGIVIETLRSGYRLGDRVIRPAQVAVGRHGVS